MYGSDVMADKINHLFPLIGQEMVWERLVCYFQKKRIANAYLFNDSWNSGGDSLAMNFASLVNCENGNNCGSCRSCAKMKKLQHPNVQLIFALPNKGKSDNPLKGFTEPDLKTFHELIQNKSEDPYVPMHYPGGNNIRISSIRAVKRSFVLESAEFGWRFVIIFDAGKLSIEAANSLLKILEEPPKDTTFLLISSSNTLLPTIQSRCQEITIPPISGENILEYLQNKFPKKSGLKSIAKLVHGDILWANQLAESQEDEIAKVGEKYLRLLKKFSTEEIVETARNWNKIFADNPSLFTKEMKILQTIFKDSWAIASNFAEIQLVDHSEIIQNCAQEFGEFDFERIAKTIENCVDLSGKNLYFTPLFIHLILTMKRNLEYRN